MNWKQQGVALFVGLSLGMGAVGFLGNSHHAALAKDEKMTNADYAREAMDHLKKAHEDVDHLVNAAADKKQKGYDDAEEAKRAIDRADKALHRYIELTEAK